jgi:hypothetical protein
VLAYNFFGCFTGGDPPFYGNCIYGANNELRGYTSGQYIDRHMFATQFEYHLALPKKFGLAGFTGVGEVVPGGKERGPRSDWPFHRVNKLIKVYLGPKVLDKRTFKK